MSTRPDSNHLGPAVVLAFAAVELGGRAMDADPAGAGDLFACARRLIRRVRGVSEVADFRLERALDEAESKADPAARARTLHKAFDSLLPDEDAPPVPADPLEAAQRFIQMAISIGAPAYNLDDRQGCYDVYACTARMILATVTGAASARARLREALDECKTLDDADRQAWAMRHGFDAVLRMSGTTGPTGSPLAAREIQAVLAAAILIGGPAFDLGDARGCYEVYACTSRLLLQSPAVPEAVKVTLRTALTDAAVVVDVSRQAWLLREAFDTILGRSSGESGGDEAS